MRFFPLAFALWTAVSVAGIRPVLPAPGEDFILSGGKPMTEFFHSRAANLDCRDELNRLKTRYLSDGSSRDELLVKLEECGDCATREVTTTTVPTGGRTEEWYISDGSCQLEGDKDTLAAGYRRIKNSLLHLKRYPQKFGGFPYVLEFVAVDPTTGAILRDVDEVTQPFYSFLSVMGKDPLGFILPAFSYFIRNDFKEIAEGKEFNLTFRTAKPPRGFQNPDVYHLEANGDKTWAVQVNIPAVHGMWYLSRHEDKRLYMRYHTAADFMMQIPYAKSFAREVLMETIFLLSQRAFGPEVI
jgi:hypothetical protein